MMTGASAALWAALGGLAGVLAGLAWVFGGLRRRLDERQREAGGEPGQGETKRGSAHGSVSP